jgi:prophage regulatory protein
MKLLSVRQVADMLGICPAFVWEKAREDATFPKPFKVSPRVTRWDEDDLKNWVLTQKQEQELTNETR